MKAEIVTIVKWLLVLPAAILGWIASDIIVPLAFNILIFISSLIHLSPLVEFLLVPVVVYWITILVSYSAAVLLGAYVAPSHNKLVAGIITVIFLAIRLGMTFTILTGNGDFTEDTPREFTIGTVAAVAGALLAYIYVLRSFKIDDHENLKGREYIDDS